MKQILTIVCIVSLVGAAIGVRVGAQTANVTASVTVGAVSVSVDPGSFDYGTRPYNTSIESFNVLSSNNIKATVGGVVTDLDIKGATTTAWTLAGTAGENTYVHAFATSTNISTQPTGYTPLTTTNAVLATHVPIGGDIFFGLKITTPTAGTGTQQSAVVTLTASFGG